MKIKYKYSMSLRIFNLSERVEKIYKEAVKLGGMQHYELIRKFEIEINPLVQELSRKTNELETIVYQQKNMRISNEQ